MDPLASFSDDGQVGKLLKVNFFRPPVLLYNGRLDYYIVK